jgi:iron(III) transport system substrate-binding protein
VRVRIVAAGILASAGLAIGLSACGGGDEATLTIYSGRSQSLVEPLIDRFAEESGIDVDVRYGDTAELALLIAEEGDNSPADVFFSQSPGAVTSLAQRDLLGEIDQASLDLVDERFRDPDGRWVGTSGRQRVLVYDSDQIDPVDLPDSVLDLTGPDFEGKVAVAPTNGSFQDFVTALRQIEGEDTAEAWLDGMADNDSPTYANNNAIVEAVGRGEVPMGLVNHYYNFRFLEEDPDLPSRNYEFEAGDPGALVIPSSATVIASSEQAEQAQEFVAFLLSEESQLYFAEETFEYPLARDVAAAVDVTPLEDLSPPAIDIGTLGDLEATVELIQESGLE